MRRLVAVLLAIFAFGSASAAQVVYEFRAVIGSSRTTSFAGHFFFGVTPGRHVVGTLTLDPARRVNGAIAPVVALKLVTLDTGQTIFDSAGIAVSSQMETRSAGGVESVLIKARFQNPDPEQDADAVTMDLSWASPGQGQLPADPSTLNILALKPYGWKIEVDGFEAFPCETAHCTDSYTNSQIYSFKRAAAAAEYEQNFTSTAPRWTNSGGDWATQSGYFTNAANVAFTSSVYGGQTLQPFVEVRADLYSGFTGAGNALGLVLNYTNATNFYEVRFTANGVVTINKVVNGVRTMLQTGSYSVPPKTFFHVSVLRDFEAIEVRVNNAAPITAQDATLKDGQAGLFASWNLARFDNFAIDQLSNWTTAFEEDFAFMEPHPFTPRTGTWAVQSNSYTNTSNQAAAISTAGFPSSGGDFSLYANLRAQWSNVGNRGGLVWDYRDPKNYSAVLLSARTDTRAGTVEVIEVVAGTTHVLASSTDGTLPVGFFGSVSVSRIDGVLRITAPQMSAPYLTVAQQPRGGDVGVIASWNLVRFDDVVLSAQSGPN
jgi:hypothetical protein